MNRIAEQSVANMAGGMSVTKNKFIEEWAYKRENAEKYFKYSRANWARLAIFGFAVPFAVYNLITSEMSQPNSLAEKYVTDTLKKKPHFLGYPHKEEQTEE